MTDLTDKELLAALDVKVESKSQSALSSFEENLISGFNEIQNFFQKFKRLPNNEEGRDIFERLYAVRLQRIIQLKDYFSLLEPFDKYNLLTKYISDQNSIFNDELDDLNLIRKLGVNDELDDLKQLKNVRTTEERQIAEEIAKRESCADFIKFKPIFNKLQLELDQGVRKIVKLKNRPEIKVGDFYILGGQKTYIANVGKTFMQDYGTNDSRLYIIFDNGTESKMLMRSLQRALSMDEGARKITNPSLGPLFTSQTNKGDIETGKIYILRSMSSNPVILENRDIIHKIGVTSQTIQRRIANAKEDPTFLMADVEVVASYRLFNINQKKFEHLIQKIFGSVRLDIQIPDRFGKIYSPKEWFMVPLQEVEKAVEKIIDGTITNYKFDLSKGSLVEITNATD